MMSERVMFFRLFFTFAKNWKMARDKRSFSFAFLFGSVNVCWKRSLLTETEQRLLLSITSTWRRSLKLVVSVRRTLSNPVPLIVRSEVMTAWPSGPWPWLSYFTPRRTAVTFSTKWGRLSRVFPASARAYTPWANCYDGQDERTERGANSMEA